MVKGRLITLIACGIILACGGIMAIDHAETNIGMAIGGPFLLVVGVVLAVTATMALFSRNRDPNTEPRK